MTENVSNDSSEMDPEYTGHPDNYPAWLERKEAAKRAAERRERAKAGLPPEDDQAEAGNPFVTKVNTLIDTVRKRHEKAKAALSKAADAAGDGFVTDYAYTEHLLTGYVLTIWVNIKADMRDRTDDALAWQSEIMRWCQRIEGSRQANAANGPGATWLSMVHAQQRAKAEEEFLSDSRALLNPFTSGS